MQVDATELINLMSYYQTNLTTQSHPYTDHNSYMLKVNNPTSYESMLYNEDQDDDEMAEV
jgi:hypothetical protein